MLIRLIGKVVCFTSLEGIGANMDPKIVELTLTETAKLTPALQDPKNKRRIRLALIKFVNSVSITNVAHIGGSKNSVSTLLLPKMGRSRRSVTLFVSELIRAKIRLSGLAIRTVMCRSANPHVWPKRLAYFANCPPPGVFSYQLKREDNQLKKIWKRTLCAMPQFCPFCYTRALAAAWTRLSLKASKFEVAGTSLIRLYDGFSLNSEFCCFPSSDLSVANVTKRLDGLVKSVDLGLKSYANDFSGELEVRQIYPDGAGYGIQVVRAAVFKTRPKWLPTSTIQYVPFTDPEWTNKFVDYFRYPADVLQALNKKRLAELLLVAEQPKWPRLLVTRGDMRHKLQKTSQLE